MTVTRAPEARPPDAPIVQPAASSRSRYGGLGIALRSRTAVRGPSILVGCLVFVLAALLVAGPSLFARLTTAELSHSLAGVPPKDRYLTAGTSAAMVTQPSALGDQGASRGLSSDQDQLYGTFLDQLDALTAQFPEPLASVVGPPQWSITGSAMTLPEGIGTETDPPAASVAVQTVIDLNASDVADLIAGSWPDPEIHDVGGASDIVVSEQTAAHLGLTVGQDLQLYRVAGIFRPKDPDADYWALHPGMVQPDIFDDGNLPVKITATVFLDPVNPPAFQAEGQSVQVWYPLDLTHLDGKQAGLVLSQVRGTTAKAHDLPTGPVNTQPDGSIQSLTLTAGVIPTLEDALDRITSARSVLVVAAIGPLGAVIAVVALALGAFAERRRPTIAVLATRGGSARQIRSLLAADGLATGVIPAALAILVGWLVFRSDLSPTAAILAGLAGLIPAGYLAATPIARAAARTRPDTGVRARHRYRWVAELAVLAVAAVSVYLLFAAGVQTTSSGVGLDVLVAAAPLLLAAAACVVVFRLYPLPLRLLAARYRKGRSAVGFLGSLRALRDPTVGVAPVLAVVVGVSVAVFSAVTLSTLSDGIRTAAVSSVGADLRIDALGISDDDLAAVRKVHGVTAAARFQLIHSTTVKIPNRPAPVSADIYVADVDALALVQKDVVDAVRIPAGMAAASPPAVLVSADLAADLVAAGGQIGTDSTGSAMSVDGAQVQVIGTADRLTGLGRSPTWVLGDASAGTPSKLGNFRPTTMLVALEPGADVSSVIAGITAAMGRDISTTVPAEVVSTATADPIASGLRVALIGALAVAALAAGAAVLLTMLLGTGTRTRLLAILRVLGMSIRQRRRMVVWEQAPTMVVALVVGAGLGVGLSALVRSVIDLRPFTTGEVQPAMAVGIGLLIALLGGFVVLVVAAVGVGLLLTRRIGLAAVVRVDEE